jgi:transcriptional regulator with XRE-family HTH domain
MKRTKVQSHSKLHQQFDGNPAFDKGHRRSQTYVQIGNELRSIREALGYTQAQLAQQVQMDQSDVHKLEAGIWGERGINFDTLNRVLPALGLRVSHAVTPVSGTTLSKDQKARARALTKLLQTDI